MRCSLALLVAGVAVASADNSWAFSTPTGWGTTDTAWASPTATPTWGTTWASNGTATWAATGTGAPVTWQSPVPSTGTWSAPEATSTGGAAAMATSFAGLVVAGGIAVLAL